MVKGQTGIWCWPCCSLHGLARSFGDFRKVALPWFLSTSEPFFYYDTLLLLSYFIDINADMQIYQVPFCWISTLYCLLSGKWSFTNDEFFWGNSTLCGYKSCHTGFCIECISFSFFRSFCSPHLILFLLMLAPTLWFPLKRFLFSPPEDIEHYHLYHYYLPIFISCL